MATVNRAQTEFVSFARCREASYGELNATAGNNLWKNIEPDAVSQFGNQYVRERRDPFAVDRLLRKQQLTGISAAASLEGDMTDDHMDWLAPMLVLADWQADLPEYEAATVSATGFTLSAGDASKVLDGAIVQIDANSDGLTPGVFRTTKAANAYTLAAPLSSSDKPELVKEGSAVSGQTAKGSSVTAKVRVIGYCLVGSSGKAVTVGPNGVSQAGGSLPNYETAAAETGLGSVQAGRGIFITIIDSATTAEITKTRPFIGYARLAGAGAGAINYTRAESASSTTSTLGEDTDGNVYVFMSKWIKNVPADNTKWNQDSYALGAEYARVDASENSMYETVYGCNLNGLSLRFPMQARIRMQADFIGSRKYATTTPPSNYTNATDPVSVEALATSVDIGTARLIKASDGTDITSLLKSVDMSFGNSIESDFVLDRIGSVGPQIGKFNLSLTCSALVTSQDMFTVTEEDTPAAFMLSAGTAEGWWMMDIPSLTLTSDRKMFERNMSLKLDFETDYYIDPVHKAAILISRFPWLPVTRDV